MNNILMATLFVALIFFIHFLSKNTDYIIQDNSYNILKDIESHILIDSAKISLLSFRYVDNARIVSFVYGGEFGMAVYIKGFNGKLKLDWINYGDTKCFSRIITTDRGKYVVAAGDNENCFISHIETEVNKKTIIMSTRGERYFLKIWPLLGSEIIDGITFMRLYDENNLNITEELMYDNRKTEKVIDDFVFIN